MKLFGTHHQKPILIDFYVNEGAKAVGYVMGLNSLTDYWDTAEHKYENFKREAPPFIERKPSGFVSRKPYRDYACRIEQGGALIALYNNFINAWEGPGVQRVDKAQRELGSKGVPEALIRRVAERGPQVQIVRTQPEERDKSIKSAYLIATEKATNALGYLYLENQYFQWEEWAQHLLKMRKKVMAGWNAGCSKIGLKAEDMPVMHVFIVIPTPERVEMIPRTYDTLATLGQQEHMVDQATMIAESNKRPSQPFMISATGQPAQLGVLSEVIDHANSIAKPDARKLETQFGIKVCTAMLNTCGSDGRHYKYREIYIHSKLLLIDDTFFTIGSANLNLRSMAVDSEINVTTVDPACATDLRKRIWKQLTGGGKNGADGGGGSRDEIANAFDMWVDLMETNARHKNVGNRIKGFLLPLIVKESSTKRLG